MKLNNNEKAEQRNAVERLCKLPIVRSACSNLSVLYSETKHSHPTITSVFNVVESRASAWSTNAVHKVSPIVVKLESQVSFANNVACKSLDWLETSFPLLLSPTEQFVATVENNIHMIQDVVSVAVTWVKVRMNGDGEQSLIKRAFSVAEEGLESTLSLAHSVEGFDAVQAIGQYPERLLSLSAKLSKRTYRLIESKVSGPLPPPSVLAQNLLSNCLTLIWRMPGLPEHVQRQALITVFFILHMCRLDCPSSKQEPSHRVQSRINATKGSPVQTDVDHMTGQFALTPHVVRSTRVFRFKKRFNVQ
ncbi:uncharacterized protein LOC114469850 isoform X2 [Gouania willdenowi]|uniref:uncharacterized protein LOC114469850 isoform X2 n=1 Tax=Gouania willdenowi TaxID=441366 RepID=UPI001054E4EA|nr:uncharacterized protein LOC114469850 isoform X2 [Gouania willdenowi]